MINEVQPDGTTKKIEILARDLYLRQMMVNFNLATYWKTIDYNLFQFQFYVKNELKKQSYMAMIFSNMKKC